MRSRQVLGDLAAADPFRVSRVLSVVLLLLPLATGAALAIFILSGIPLPVAAAGVAAIGATAWFAAAFVLPRAAKRKLGLRVRVGFWSGVVATFAYDATRYGLVSIAALSFRPFHVWRLFGATFVGSDAPDELQIAVGALFHLSNGVGFAVAYALLVPRPGLITGLIWAALLELAMVSLYPSWLQLRAIGEFLTVSIAGHAAYGSVLGLTARRLLRSAGNPPGLPVFGGSW
jgi:hypothetical protein